MKRTRRTVLGTASSLTTMALLFGGSASATTQEYPEWDPDTVYTGGDRVIHEGYVWEANWWTRGSEPGEGGEWGPWDEIEPVEDDPDPDPEPEPDPEPPELNATITASTTRIDVGDEIEFDASDSDGDIDDYAWDLGDGTDASGEAVTHSYDETGEYAVELTVTDTDGETDTDSTTVTVTEESESDVTADTTLEEFFSAYDTDFNPVETEGGVPGLLQAELHEDASEFGADLEAIESNAADGSMELGALGDRGLELVKRFDADGVARETTARLMPWLAGLAEETEPIPFNDGGGRDGGLTADAGPVSATNDPPTLVQDAWPSGEQFDDVYQQSERSDWSSGVSQSQHTNTENPIIDATTNKEHPLTGESLGEGFTANAPLEATAELHGEGWLFDMALVFENVTDVPLLVDGAVIWWVGPSKGGTGLDQFSYDNAQRKNFSVGHPQRDVIEVALPDAAKPGPFEGTDAPLSAYGVRMAQHNNPYLYRTLYPNQQFSMTYGNVTGPSQYDWPYDDLLEVMLETCHVEFREELDDIERNTELVDTLDMKNRYGN
ncbi:PKD domain-containing protein [Halobiforma nitratireducens]|uniref:PKD domain-containing protein n=1 Tax=Halobiforma nitratireducens JCM 10879 TaxID=1227454 RepID=M0MLQ6_9EURY|nr:PKD domain-containing protein [Halobiforma nitratireducens]EMA46581.1 PKD domain-containing protein [Halobiforma nitratireducens JCM 10879]